MIRTGFAVLLTIPFLLAACAQVDEGVEEDVMESEAMANDLPI